MNANAKHFQIIINFNIVPTYIALTKVTNILPYWTCAKGQIVVEVHHVVPCAIEAIVGSRFWFIMHYIISFWLRLIILFY